MAKKRKADYHIGAWNGIRQYRCAHCPWDTLDREAMERHLTERHRPPPEPKPPSPIIVTDRFGQPVQRE